MEQYIVSFADGRIRLRHPILHDADLGAEIAQFLQAIPGMEKIEHKALTGSLLIMYDPEQLSIEELQGLLAQGGEWLKENAPEHALEESTEEVEKGSCVYFTLPSLSTAQKRKALKRGMAFSMLLTLGSLVIGGSRLHVTAGTALALFALEHVWQRRRAL